MAAPHSPLHQFEIVPIAAADLGGFHVVLTNSALFMVLAVILVYGFLKFGVRKAAMVPGYWQNMAESSYEFVRTTVHDTAGFEAKPYIPLIFTLFFFILSANLLGLTPYSFTVTSHIVVTFALASLVFLTVTFVGLYLHGLKFLKLFVPSGVPLVLMPVMIPVEVISYLARPITLSIRLAANMTAGHILLKVVAGFVIALGVVGVLPLLLLSGLIGFELFIAFLQAYIFTILSCVYLHDAIHLH